jgi:polysaccharide export outer membrane protein
MSRHHACLFLVFLWLAIAFALTGCNTTNLSTEEAAASREAIEKELKEKPFLIGVDDIVKVYVHLKPGVAPEYEISGEYVVGPEGVIFMPLLGDVQAAGLTKADLEESLKEKLSEFIIEPQVSVGISQYMSKKVYVIGEVALPGPVPMKGNILTVWDAIVASGFPLKTAALWRVHIISPDAEKPVAKRINLRSIMYRGKFAHNDFLKPNDIVVVPSSTAASLGSYLGQIVTPAAQGRSLAEVYDFFKNKSIYLDRNYGRFTQWPQ